VGAAHRRNHQHAPFWPAAGEGAQSTIFVSANSVTKSKLLTPRLHWKHLILRRYPAKSRIFERDAEK